MSVHCCGHGDGMWCQGWASLDLSGLVCDYEGRAKALLVRCKLQVDPGPQTHLYCLSLSLSLFLSLSLSASLIIYWLYSLFHWWLANTAIHLCIPCLWRRKTLLLVWERAWSKDSFDIALGKTAWWERNETYLYCLNPKNKEETFWDCLNQSNVGIQNKYMPLGHSLCLVLVLKHQSISLCIDIWKSHAISERLIIVRFQRSRQWLINLRGAVYSNSIESTLIVHSRYVFFPGPILGSLALHWFMTQGARLA